MSQTFRQIATETGRSRLSELRWDDYAILLILLALSGLGIVVLLSSTYVINAGDAYALLRRQLIWLGIALGAFFVGWRMNVEAVRPVLWWFIPIVLLLSVLVFVPPLGREINGAHRWLILGPFRLQVSETVKVLLVFFMAHHLATHQRRLDHWWYGFGAPCAIIGISSGLIIIQPDFGTALLCALVGGTMLFLAGGSLLYWIPTGFLGLVGFAIMVWRDPVRLSRVTSYVSLSDEAIRSGEGYQLWQGLVGFASGGTSGVGLGAGRQQLNYLPEAHTDFIFAIVGEELGLVFTLLIAGLFCALFCLVVFKNRSAGSVYQTLLVQGCLAFIIYQALINMGVVTGLLPTKGMSLPFISYGGSNLVLMFFFTAIILNLTTSWRRYENIKGGGA